MSTLALIHPDELVAKELQEQLDRNRALWTDLRLLSDDEAVVGTITEVRGAAAIVQRLEPDSLEGVDVVFLAGNAARNRRLLPLLQGATGILLSPDAGPADGTPVVTGINLADAQPGTVLSSPHPATIALCHVLQPLLTYQPTRVAATVIEPASASGAAGLDEVLDQSRGLLAFQSDLPKTVFGHQLAFNLLPGPDFGPSIAPSVQHVLATEVPIAVNILRGGIFHAHSLSIYVELLDDPGEGSIHGMLGENDVLELVETVGEVGPVLASGRDKILVGDVRPAPQTPGGYWLWAVVDNLTVGGVDNAMAMLEALVDTHVTH